MGLAVQVVPFHEYAIGDSSESWLTPKPTAMQKAGVVHDVLTSWPSVSPPERLSACADHVEPFHCATTGARPSSLPTAWQKVALRQDTPSRSVATPRLVVTTVQADPFHCSTRTSGEPIPAGVTPPTATQNDVVTQETPASVVDAAPATVGSAMGDHVLPFQSSA